MVVGDQFGTLGGVSGTGTFVPRSLSAGWPATGATLAARSRAGADGASGGCLTVVRTPRLGRWAAIVGEVGDRLLTLFLCGDVMTGRGVDQILPHPVGPELRERYVNDARAYVRLAERANGPIPRPAFPGPGGMPCGSSRTCPQMSG